MDNSVPHQYPTKTNSPSVILSCEAAIKISFNTSICTKQIITKTNKQKNSIALVPFDLMGSENTSNFLFAEKRSGF